MKKFIFILIIILIITNISYSDNSRDYADYVPDYISHIVQNIDYITYILDKKNPGEVYNNLNKLLNIRKYYRISSNLYNIENILKDNGIKVKTIEKDKILQIKERFDNIQKFIFSNIIENSKKIFLIDKFVSNTMIELLKLDKFVINKYKDTCLMEMLKKLYQFQKKTKNNFENIAINKKIKSRKKLEILLFNITDLDILPYHFLTENNIEIDLNNSNYYFYIIQPRFNMIFSTIATKAFDLELSEITMKKFILNLN